MRCISLIILFLAMSSAFISCCGIMTEKEAIKNSYGKVVDFTWEKQYVTADTILLESTSLKTPIKIVSFMDEDLCAPCLSKYLIGASRYMKRFPVDSVVFICIVASNSDEQLKECAVGIDNSSSCILIKDVNTSFVSMNSLDRYNTFCRAFLLDSNNRIVLTGDPLRNSNLQKLYTEKISALISFGGELPKKASQRNGAPEFGR